MARAGSALRFFGWAAVIAALCILASSCNHYTIPNEEESGGGEELSAVTAAIIAGEFSARDGIWIEFSAPMDRDSVENNFLFTDSEGVEMEPSLSWESGPSASLSAAEGTTDILKIQYPFPYCSEFHITILKHATDAAGLPLADDVRLAAASGANPLDFDRGAACGAEYLASCTGDACLDKGVTIFTAGELFEQSPVDLRTLDTGEAGIWYSHRGIGGAIVPDATGDGFADLWMFREVEGESFVALFIDSFMKFVSGYSPINTDIELSTLADEIALPVGTGDVGGDGVTDQAIGRIESGLLRTYLLIGGFEEGSYTLEEIGTVIDEMPAAGAHSYCQNWGIREDLSGDGLGDIAICENAAATGESDANEVRVLFGAGDPAAVAVGARVVSPAADKFFDAAIAGDIDGDGAADLIVREASGDASTAYVFFGPIAAQATEADALELTDADVVIEGAGEAGSGEPTILVAGDVNGDGRDDLLIGDRNSYIGGASPDGEPLGAAYVLLGRESWSDSIRTNARYDLLIIGTGTTRSAGMRLEAVGDIDNDGYDDFMVGAYDEGYAGDWNNIFLGGGGDRFGGMYVTTDSADAVVMKD